MSVGIAAIAYAFPEGVSTVHDLVAAGRVRSEAAVLERLGFARVHTALHETPFDLAKRACLDLLEQHDIDPESIDALVYGGPQGPTAFANSPSPELSSASHRTTARFQYPGARLQHELGMLRSQVFGLDQMACATMFGAVRIARSLCIAERLERVLCVSSDFFPADAGREEIYNCTSDAAVALLVERDSGRNRIRSMRHVTKGYYWNPAPLGNQLVATYFPTAQHVIAGVLADAGWARGDVDWLIPHNVSRPSWEILRELTGLSSARIWDTNIARDGHTLAGDNFINLADAVSTGSVGTCDRMVLFSFGYGGHWVALAVEA